MFYEEGWVPISDVTAEVFRTLQGVQVEKNLPHLQAGLRRVLAISVWDICDASTKVGVTGPDGVVVPASTDLLSWSDPTELENEHLNLRLGTLGSSRQPGEDGAIPTPDDMRLRYGPFFGLPVVIPTNNFQSSMTFLAEEVAGEDPKDEATLKAAATILRMVQAGELVTRGIARQKLGPTLSRRKFKQAWAKAAEHVPDLSLPNRWQGL